MKSNFLTQSRIIKFLSYIAIAIAIAAIIVWTDWSFSPFSCFSSESVPSNIVRFFPRGQEFERWQNSTFANRSRRRGYDENLTEDPWYSYKMDAIKINDFAEGSLMLATAKQQKLPSYIGSTFVNKDGKMLAIFCRTKEPSLMLPDPLIFENIVNQKAFEISDPSPKTFSIAKLRCNLQSLQMP